MIKVGKPVAVEALNEYGGVYRGWGHEMFSLLRILFEVPKNTGAMPPMMIGAPYPTPPEDPRKFPRWPIVMVDDLPFSVCPTYTLMGFPEHWTDHLKYFEKHGIIKKTR
ncbi:MAG: hypothetical protein ABJA67_06780 [Chthonomonadales bacterium]